MRQTRVGLVKDRYTNKQIFQNQMYVLENRLVTVWELKDRLVTPKEIIATGRLVNAKVGVHTILSTDSKQKPLTEFYSDDIVAVGIRANAKVAGLDITINIRRSQEVE